MASAGYIGTRKRCHLEVLPQACLVSVSHYQTELENGRVYGQQVHGVSFSGAPTPSPCF